MFIAIILAAVALSPPNDLRAESAPAAAPEAQPTAEAQIREANDTLARADEARDRDRLSDALVAYRDALKRYSTFAERYPNWQPAVLRFRMAYCQDQVDALSTRAAAAPPPAPDAPHTAAVPAPSPAPDAPVPAPSGDAGAASRADLARLTDAARRLLADGNLAEARTLLVRTLRVAPDDPKTRLMLGILHNQAGEYSNAAAILEPLSRDTPESPHVRVALAGAYLALGRTDDAIQEIKDALLLDPSMSEAHFNLAQSLLHATPPDPETARHHYRKAISLGGKPDAQIEAFFKEPPTATPPP